MGERGPVYRGREIHRVHAKLPFSVYPGMSFIGYDESGFFPPKKDETSDRYTRMVLYAARSRNPSDSVVFKDGSHRRSYTKANQFSGCYSGVWGELNGVHSRVRELRDNNMLTRIISTAYLICNAGYDGLPSTHATIDRFWPRTSDDVFMAVLEYFGAEPSRGTLSIKPHADKRVPVVREAHEKSHRIWASPSRHRDHADTRIDIPPETIMGCIMYLEKYYSKGLTLLRESDFTETFDEDKI